VDQVAALQTQLKQAADEYAQMEQDVARVKVDSSNSPLLGHLQHLKTVQHELELRNKEVSAKTAEIDKLRDFMVNADIKCASLREDDRVQFQSQMAELQQRVETLESERANKQRQISEMARSASEASRAMQMQKGEAAQHINRLQGELQMARENLDHERKQFQTQMQMTRRELDQRRAQLELKFQEQANQLKDQFSRQRRILESQREAHLLQMKEKEQTWATLRSDMDRAQKDMANRQRAINDRESKYVNGMARAEQEIAKAKNSLVESQNRVARFHAIEQDYITQINLLQQKIEILREESRREADGLRTQNTDLLKARQASNMSLEKCSASSAALVNRINDLSASHAKLRSERDLIKKRMDTMRVEFEGATARMRAENQTIKGEAMQCASKLQLGAQVHNHVLDIQRDMEAAKSRAAQTLAAAKQTEDALKMALRQSEQSAYEIAKLQDMLKQVEQEKRLVKIDNDSLRTELKDLRRMDSKVTQDMNLLAEEYKQAMDNQEAERVRERRRIQAEERNYRNKIREMDVRAKEDAQRLQALAKQKANVQNILADTQVDHARQVTNLLETDQLLTQFMNKDRIGSIQPTGTSLLLTK
jgi:chromosome segregation ATPase